jgi:hypothetical protein
MNRIKLVPRTPAHLTEATVALSSVEVDIIIEALARFRASNWRTETRSVANKAESLRDRLLTVRDVS